MARDSLDADARPRWTTPEPAPDPTTRIDTPGTGAQLDLPADESAGLRPVEPTHLRSCRCADGALRARPGTAHVCRAAGEPDEPAHGIELGATAAARRRRTTAGVIAGLIVLGLGLWFFADRTLGLDMPTSAGASSGR